jgi:hypothetical protein
VVVDGERDFRRRRQCLKSSLHRSPPLIDGRNRLKACEIAGVAPTFRDLNGEDPVAFIVSANLAFDFEARGQSQLCP